MIDENIFTDGNKQSKVGMKGRELYRITVPFLAFLAVLSQMAVIREQSDDG